MMRLLIGVGTALLVIIIFNNGCSHRKAETARYEEERKAVFALDTHRRTEENAHVFCMEATDDARQNCVPAHLVRREEFVRFVPMNKWKETGFLASLYEDPKETGWYSLTSDHNGQLRGPFLHEGVTGSARLRSLDAELWGGSRFGLDDRGRREESNICFARTREACQEYFIRVRKGQL